jgi:hypothetical protein
MSKMAVNFLPQSLPVVSHFIAGMEKEAVSKKRDLL